MNYSVIGLVYKFNKDGEAIGILRRIYCDGTACLGRNLLGAIHRQNPDLLPCHAISVSYDEL